MREVMGEGGREVTKEVTREGGGSRGREGGHKGGREVTREGGHEGGRSRRLRITILRVEFSSAVSRRCQTESPS